VTDGLATFHRRKTGGHYARLMGTLWRHKKPETAGDAALGMWMRMLSYCADVGRQVLSSREMAILMAGDKNGPRKLSALLKAGLVDRTEGGLTPHDWFDHNPGTRPSDAENGTRTQRDGEGDAREREDNVTTNVTRIVRNGPEQSRVDKPPLSRPKTQEEEKENPSLRSGVGAAAPTAGGEPGLELLPHEPNAEPPPKKPRDEARLLWADTLAGEAKALRIPKPDVGGKVRDAVIRMARERAAETGEAFPSVLRTWVIGGLTDHVKTGKPAQWALKDWRPYAPAQPARTNGRPRLAAATTHLDFADAEPLETQLARMREDHV